MKLSDARVELLCHVGFIWHRLTNLARVHEEVGREWLLPTHLSDAHAEM